MTSNDPTTGPTRRNPSGEHGRHASEPATVAHEQTPATERHPVQDEHDTVRDERLRRDSEAHPTTAVYTEQPPAGATAAGAAAPAAAAARHDEDRDDRDREDRDRDVVVDREPVEVRDEVVDHDTMIARGRERFGGMKAGSAFFGWLTAMGMAVLLTALAAATGTAVGLSTDTSLAEATNQAAQDPQTVGITGAIILLVILILSYYCGGYVAGRMARFNGARQGLAVWLWALVIAVLIAVMGLVLGSQFDILARVNAFPRLPLNEGTLSTWGLAAVVIAALASLAGAVLGGVAGMRYHRRVDDLAFVATDADDDVRDVRKGDR